MVRKESFEAAAVTPTGPMPEALPGSSGPKSEAAGGGRKWSRSARAQKKPGKTGHSATWCHFLQFPARGINGR